MAKAKKDRSGSGGGGGGQPRVYITWPETENFLSKSPKKADAYDVSIEYGATWAPKDAFRVIFKVNGENVVGTYWVTGTRHAATLEGIKLYESKSNVIRIEKLGFSDQGCDLEVSSDQVKKAAGKSTSTPAHAASNQINRFKVTVGSVRLDGTNPVWFETYAEDGQTPQAGQVTIDPGQKFDFNGKVYEKGVVTVPTGSDGRGSCHIKVLERDDAVSFTHEESGQVRSKLLLKEG